MRSHSRVFLFAQRRNFKWLCLLTGVVVALASLQSYFVLQQLSAIALFTALFIIVAALIFVFLLLVAAVDHVFGWSMVALAPIGRRLQSSIRDVVMLSMRGSVISHRDTSRTSRN